MWRLAPLLAGVVIALGMTVERAGGGPSRFEAVRLPVTMAEVADERATVVVEPGDHLWKISTRHVAPSQGPVEPFWLEVIDLNTPNLRSGDPDLIYPGEVIELP